MQRFYYQPKVNNSPRMLVKKAFLRRVMILAHREAKAYDATDQYDVKAYDHFSYFLREGWRKQKRDKKFNWSQNVLF